MFGNREIDLLRRALALYAGEHVLSRVTSEGEKFLAPNARPVELTMLSYDVASFTEPPRGFTLEGIREWSAEFAEAMTTAVAKSKGTFDTFIGDAGSAWWGEDGAADHPAQAVACAREMLRAVERLNERKPDTFPAVALVVGLHTGLVSLGNIGSSSRLHYCPVGDSVNLTARLCGIANNYRKPVILSEMTYDRLTDQADIEFLEAVRVKGRPESLRVYGLAKG